jgi:predicted transcriptional regulator
MRNSMSETTFTFRVDEALKNEFGATAKATEDATWFRREVQTGIDAANAGDVLPAEDVEAEALAWRAEIHRTTGVA